jgi:hypothetical protein
MPTKASLPPRSQAEIAAQLAAQFRYASFDEYLRDQGLMRAIDQVLSITYGMFRMLVKEKGWTAEEIAARCKGQIDEPSRTVHRILVTYPADTVIPYTCLIE